MGDAPSSRQSAGPGRSAAGNSANLREFSNREPTIRAGWAPDSPAERQASTLRLPRAHFAEGASAPRLMPREICSAPSNRKLTIRAGWVPDGISDRRVPSSRSPRAYLANGASAPKRTPRGICSPRSNRDSTMRRASPSRLPRRHWATGSSAPRLKTRGIYSALSNRELLGLEILQLVENKHHRPVLIANFEPSCTRHFRPIL
jgi:hypothetical protein